MNIFESQTLTDLKANLSSYNAEQLAEIKEISYSFSSDPESFFGKIYKEVTTELSKRNVKFYEVKSHAIKNLDKHNEAIDFLNRNK